MQNKLPRITVITPCLNQAEFIERTICSVLDQGYENLEYIVMDGGSVDGSDQLIELYTDDLAYWQSAPDAGPADAVNQAIQRATGDIIAVLSADDLYLPDTLHKIAKRMLRDDAPQWVVGHCLRIGEMDEQLGQINAEQPDDLAGFVNDDAGHVPMAGTFYRREVFETHGGFDTSLRFAWSYELSCRLLAQDLAPTVYPAVLSACREHAQSRSAQNVLSTGPEYCEAAVRHADHLPFAERGALASDIEQRYAIYDLARQEIAGAPARRHLWNQLLRRPWWLANTRYRTTLLQGVAHPDTLAQRPDDATQAPIRRAA